MIYRNSEEKYFLREHMGRKIAVVLSTELVGVIAAFKQLRKPA